MKKNIRILSLILALFMLAAALVGCNESQQPAPETEAQTGESTEVAPTLTVNGVALADYTIVYAAKATTGGKKAAEYLNQKFSTLYGVELQMETKRQDRPEILIGLDGNDATIAAAYQEHPTGLVGVTDKKIVLLGVNYSALCRLIDAFLAKATAAESGIAISVTECEFPDTEMDSISVMSYNVLGDLDKPGRPTDAREQMVQTVLQNDADVFGTQEDNPENHEVFLGLLENYSSYVGAEEGNHIYWKTEKFNLIKKGYYYLSNTPAVRSKYEDSTQYRTLSYVILEIKETGKQFIFVATHLDYRASEETRVKQVNALASLIKKINKDALPVVLVGDFNSLATRSNGAIPTFLGNNPDFVMTSKAAEKKGDTGESLVSQDDFATRYLGVFDYIFVSVDNVYTRYYTIVNNISDGKYPSDHLPVLVQIDIY